MTWRSSATARASTSGIPASPSAPWRGFATPRRAARPAVLHRPCEGTFEAAAGTLARILEERPDTTGFVVQNEGAIVPLLSLLRVTGRTVPEDASVVALCPEQLAEQTAPRLTAVTDPADRTRHRAVELVMAPDRRRRPRRRSGTLPAGPVLTVREQHRPRAPKSPTTLRPHWFHRATPHTGGSTSDATSARSCRHAGFEWRGLRRPCASRRGARTPSGSGPSRRRDPRRPPRALLGSAPPRARQGGGSTSSTARLVNGAIDRELTSGGTEHRSADLLRFRPPPRPAA